MAGLTINEILNCKLQGILIRLLDLFRLFPVRVVRVYRHLKAAVSDFPMHVKELFITGDLPMLVRNGTHWLVELPFLVIDCLGAGEVYETFFDLAKFNTRPLAREELVMARTVFGGRLNYKRIRIDEHSFAGPLHWKFAYVSCYTINCWGRLDPGILIHELAHVWQYEQMGALYIPRALRAQFSPMGYDYGGVPGLKDTQSEGSGMGAFNLEQQAEILTDYFLISKGRLPHWGRGNSGDLPLYEYFVNQVRG